MRTYRVTLKVNGTLERVYPTLTSDPPLTALQILNLLAGADENTVAGLQTQADQARLAATGAATLAAGKIAEEVGLERGAERLLGLNRFSIDPSVVRGGLSNPTARITLGKRITPDLSVQYSLDLRGSQERILSVEYTLSDRLSVLLDELPDQRCRLRRRDAPLAVTSLLSLAALALAIAPPPVATERVASVRVEAPVGYDAARLSAYLAIAPGDAFEPAAIRKTVGLLYATGRFEDVVVDATTGPGGVDLVIRPVPAPLLDRIVVEGDRLASPRSLARITRLRRWEPLWPARLDAAAQAAALAFAAEGYLEAHVGATARPRGNDSDAVFRITSGPRVRVGRVSIEGAPGSEAPYLRTLAPRAGSVFRRALERRSADRMRAHLVSKGFWRAKSDVLETYRPDTAHIDLLFRLTPDRRTSVEFRGARLPGKLQSVLTGVLRDGGLATDAVEQVADRIEESLRVEGYRDAFVSHREETRGDESVVVYVTEPGPQARVSAVQFSGFDAAGIETLPETRPLGPLVDRTVDEDVRRLERWLQAEGYSAAHVEADVPDGGGSLAVTFLIRPGTRTFVHDVVVEGGVAGLPPLAVRSLEYRRAL